MRVAIAYPPLISDKGVPLLSQNRQFQWFSRPTYIYPMVPAWAATMARDAGHTVSWLDGIASEWSVEQFEAELAAAQPEVILLETKTPVIKRHWQYLKRLKELHPRLLTVLVGDHVTALPHESFANSPVDFILTGGDYDFLWLNLLAALQDAQNAGHPLDTTRLEAGIYWRQTNGGASNGAFELKHDLKKLPRIDRELTQWRLYAFRNGNFRTVPGTYIMSGRDCWHGKCTFCSWTTLYPTYRARDPREVVDEIGELIEKYGVREIMDDTGTLPAGSWLTTFCEEMIARGYHKRVRIDCNMRFGCLDADQYRLMRRAGFRLVLFGLESANQATLERLEKGLTVDQITTGARAAARAGLDVHVTVMFGYPWEGPEETAHTIRLAQTLLRKGYAYTLQVTMVVPYPGTPLFRELAEHNLLLTQDWECYDMRQPVMQTALSEPEIKNAIRRVYGTFLHPETILRRLFTTRNLWVDLKFYWRGFRSVLGHLRNFRASS